MDSVLPRAFEGVGERRYAALERPAFGDLDDRLLDAWPALAAATTLLDLGAGGGAFAARAAVRHPHQIRATMFRHAFGPLVVRTAPPRATIAELASAAGWRVRTQRDDPAQPVYILELA